jgi:hypothetical protein
MFHDPGKDPHTCTLKCSDANDGRGGQGGYIGSRSRKTLDYCLSMLSNDFPDLRQSH